MAVSTKTTNRADKIMAVTILGITGLFASISLAVAAPNNDAANQVNSSVPTVQQTSSGGLGSK